LLIFISPAAFLMKLVGIMAAVLEYVLTSSGAIKIDASRVKDIQLFSSLKFSSILFSSSGDFSE
jgi:hypothetical protein